MLFILAATQVLAELAESRLNIVAWTHDLAASNQDYSLPRNSIVDMVRERHSNIRYVAVSQARASEFQELTGSNVDAVIPNGLDLSTFLVLTPQVETFLSEIDTHTILLIL